jgi:GntR family transcriptional regulator
VHVIRISRDSDVPLHEQLSAQIVLRIGTGKLKPGDALPSVRGLDRQLGIHHNTVAEDYQDRVLEMLVVKRPGSRLIVRDRSHQSAEPAGDLDGGVDMAIQVAREQGYSTQQLVERFRQ